MRLKAKLRRDLRVATKRYYEINTTTAALPSDLESLAEVVWMDNGLGERARERLLHFFVNMPVQFMLELEEIEIEKLVR